MPGNHQVLVCGNYPHGAGAIVCGNDACIGIIIHEIKMYSKIIETVTDHPPYRCSPLTNASGEYQGIQSVKDSG